VTTLPPGGATVEGSRRQAASLGLLALAVLLVMSLWFSATAVTPAIQAAWGLSTGAASWLTLAVQLGFVVGTLGSGLANLPDRFPTHRLIAVSALGAAGTTLAFALWAGGPGWGVPLRFLTGVLLAGVYPPGMKLAATWTTRGRGLAVGLLVGALTVGSASPHLLRGLLVADWQVVMAAASGLALAGALVVALAVREGPYVSRGARFDPRFALRMVRTRALALANLGYLGHMWELYALWTWAPAFIALVLAERGAGEGAAGVLSFAIIGVGGAGCVLAGLAADRWGRTATTSAAMIASGGSAIAAAALTGGPLWALVPVLFLWGFTVIADSAQFSAAISELASREFVGSALTLQTGAGFLLTMGSIRLMPVLVDAWGWSAGFLMLAAGPAVGTAAMLTLRRLPEALACAGGRR
jgi:MFS family permease